MEEEKEEEEEEKEEEGEPTPACLSPSELPIQAPGGEGRPALQG